MTTPATNEFRKTNVTLSRRDRRHFKQMLLEWEDEYDFPIELKESHALNAAVQLLLLAGNSEAIETFMEEQGMESDQEKENMRNGFKWFLNQYMRVLGEGINERISVDKRRVHPV
ncbi:hypothetical protein [Actinoplanes sp. GCM10030250]|uniref:hypothetical protein n=1 Tax=Actinoplanes sp. GCM10030250 TaxID=3273376 RepID=UPI00361DA9B5